MSERREGALGIAGAFGWTCFAFGAALGLQLAIAAVLVLVEGSAWIDAAAHLRRHPASLALATVVAYGGVAFHLTRRRAATRELPIVLDARPPVVALALVLGAALAFPLSEIANAVTELRGTYDPAAALELQRRLEPRGFARGATLVFALVVLVPVAEEALFRGALFSGLQARYDERRAALVTTLLFALVHVRLEAVAPALVAGLLFAGLRHVFGSVLPGLAVHAAVNAMPLLLPRRLASIPGFNTVGEAPGHVPWPLLLASLGVALAALIALLRYARE